MAKQTRVSGGPKHQTTVGAMRGAGPGMHKENAHGKGGGPIAKIGPKTNKKPTKKKA
jgi:hypothetical protein